MSDDARCVADQVGAFNRLSLGAGVREPVEILVFALLPGWPTLHAGLVGQLDDEVGNLSAKFKSEFIIGDRLVFDGVVQIGSRDSAAGVALHAAAYASAVPRSAPNRAIIDNIKDRKARRM